MTSTLPLGIVAASRAPSGGAFGLVEQRFGGAESNSGVFYMPYAQPIEPGDFIIYFSWYYLFNLEYSATGVSGLGATWTRDNFAAQQAVAPTANMWWGVAQTASESMGGQIAITPHVYRSGGWYWNIRGANPASFQYAYSDTPTTPVMSAGPNSFVGAMAMENTALSPVPSSSSPIDGWVNDSVASVRWGGGISHRMVGDETVDHQVTFNNTPKTLIFKLDAA